MSQWEVSTQIPETDRAFLAVGFFFCLFTSFTLAKTIRDNRDDGIEIRLHTPRTPPALMTMPCFASSFAARVCPWVGFSSE